MQQIRKETDPGLVTDIPNLNKIDVNNVHAALQRMSVEVYTRQ